MKLPLFEGYMVIYVENAMEAAKKTIRNNKEFSRLQDIRSTNELVTTDTIW